MPKRISNPVLCIIICCFLFLISCGGGGSGESALQSPRIFVSKTQIDFGDIVIDEIAEQAFSIKNVGSSTLSIGQIAQADQLNLPYSILNNNCSGSSLATNQTCIFSIRFSPTSQGKGFSDSFDIPSNDPNFASVTVGVIGNAEGLRLSINQVTTNNFPNIELIISVSNKDGNPITNLQNDNVTLSENGEPMSIELTPFLSPMPISVAMLLDSSDTMTPFIDNVELSSKQFVNLLNFDDEAAVIKFARTIELKQTYTKNKDSLISGIDNAYTGPIDATLMYDTLWYAIDMAAVRPNHRSIILISDGKDELPPNTPGSVKTLTQVIDHAKETVVSIYTIGLGEPVYAAILNQLANETGGQYFAAPSSDQLFGVYQAIRDILDGQYKISYTTSSTACDPVMVNVEVVTNGFQGDAVKQVQVCP